MRYVHSTTNFNPNREKRSRFIYFSGKKIKYIKDTLNASDEDIERLKSNPYKALLIHTIDPKTGHIDMGWAARIGENGEHIVMAVRIGAKSAGPQGFFRQETEEFMYKAFTGEKYSLPYSVFCTLPVDLNGDGVHELVRGLAEGNGEVIDRKGRVIGNIDGSAAIASKFMDHPGEQILSYGRDGIIRVWADRNAKDSIQALERYKHPFYKANQRLTATGYNVVNLGGL